MCLCLLEHHSYCIYLLKPVLTLTHLINEVAFSSVSVQLSTLNIKV